ncbi:MAG: phosphoribosylanthranilate isomerase [Pyrinomonadaceae bacterium]
MTRVKICGITNLDDALLAIKFGADELGFNFYKKSPRFITPDAAKVIVDGLPKDISLVGVFVNESIDAIATTANRVGLGTIQLHGDEDIDFVNAVRDSSGLKVIKAIRVAPDFAPSDATGFNADAILLDGFSAKERGGTGETFDWEIARMVRALVPGLYLAGGLSSANVGDAIRKVQPDAVDTCSRIESEPGKKDAAKLKDFIKAVKETI